MTATPPEILDALESVTAGDAASSERIYQIERQNRPWVCGAGVQALGVGPKVTDGVETPELALRVYVAQKKPLKDVENPVPRKVAGCGGDAVTTDVIEIGDLGAELYTGRSRPLVPGIGVGNVQDNTVGTLGAIVRLRANGGLAILSNAHVLARDGLSDPGEEIVQPAIPDGGVAGTDQVARVTRTQPFDFADIGFPNLVDAAIAEMVGHTNEQQIRLLGHAPKGITTSLRRGMHVHKVGRTSDLTTGIIQDVHFRLHFPLRQQANRRHRVGFRDQVMCTKFTQPGDSGALVLSSSGRAVGLHFAGSETASIFNRITHVLDALDIDLVLEGLR